jgi:hypothetical protein
MTESNRDSRLQQPDAQDVKDVTEARRRAGLNAPEGDTDVTPDGEDVSPHHGRRAQPGDVLGLETGGETTTIGDTAEDENKRRRDSAKTDSE